ncbi:malonate--CoA ligase [Amaricoccus solimangrovi]|uniref:Malonyl-CoA synthase n=1 Tax=Amaricoccus solimangrovi TaxID=2589815 RepID=A0A501WWT0_9RHOB|nr:malonyl-CoA synthase [Amaricoccus solimangrovi]TPE53182.1 malonyl-CoA synthase [Amaricoccus solimangrovi]
MNGNLFARLAARFPADASTVAIETPEGRAITYADLLAASGRMAAVLRAEGVVPGDRVMVQVEKSPEAVFLYLACLQVGAIYLPLNTAYTASELAYFIADAEPRVLVCDPGAEAALRPLAERVGALPLTLDAGGRGGLTTAALAKAPDTAVAARAGADVAAILYTSGTTGRSKGAMLTGDNLWSNALTLSEAWGFSGADVLLHALPIYHTHGLFVALNLTLMNGGRVLFLPKFDAELILELMPRATVLMGVPTFYTRLLASPRLTRPRARAMRLFISGSAPLLAQTHVEFEARTGQRILERYGMTETGMNTSNPLEGDRRAGTVGPALPGVELRLGDPAASGYRPAEGVGVLEVRGPNVFAGYWRMPEKTAAEKRADGFFITGDLATISEDGYVTIVGRARDLVISGGLNVYPKEVEEAIDALPEVIESAVIGVPHPDLGEAVVAVVATRGDPGDVTGALRGRLAAFKLPRHVALVEDLPRNAMGKVQKAALRERFAGLFA